MVNLLFISGSEIIVVGLVVLLLFGAKSIPDVARMLGKGMNEFRRASDEIKRELRNQTNDVRSDIEDMRTYINKEAEGMKKSIDKDLSDDDPYNLKSKENSSSEKQAQSNNKQQDLPPTNQEQHFQSEGPISRDTNIED